MKILEFLSQINVLHTQVQGSPSKGWFKFCGPFTDCPDNAPHWLPLVLFAGFFVIVVLLARRVRSKGNYRRVTRGPKPVRPFTNPPKADKGQTKDENT